MKNGGQFGERVGISEGWAEVVRVVSGVKPRTVIRMDLLCREFRMICSIQAGDVFALMENRH